MMKLKEQSETEQSNEDRMDEAYYFMDALLWWLSSEDQSYETVGDLNANRMKGMRGMADSTARALRAMLPKEALEMLEREYSMWVEEFSDLLEEDTGPTVFDSDEDQDEDEDDENEDDDDDEQPGLNSGPVSTKLRRVDLRLPKRVLDRLDRLGRPNAASREDVINAAISDYLLALNGYGPYMVNPQRVAVRIKSDLHSELDQLGHSYKSRAFNVRLALAHYFLTHEVDRG